MVKPGLSMPSSRFSKQKDVFDQKRFGMEKNQPSSTKRISEEFQIKEKTVQPKEIKKPVMPFQKN